MVKMVLIGISGLGGAVCYFHGPEVWAHVCAHAAAALAYLG